MKDYAWNNAKNILLKSSRDISFEEVVIAINEGGLLGKIKHPNQNKYPGQKIFILKIRSYIYLIPFVEDEEKVFLKTIIPSRKATKKYLKKEVEK